MNDKYTNGDYQRKVGKLVDREVIYCVSYLVSEVVKLDEMEEFWGMLWRDDWENPTIYHINNMDRDECTEYLNAIYIDVKDGERMDGVKSDIYDEKEWPLEDLREAVQSDASEDWQETGEALGVTPEQNEALEHWIVSNWLAARLEERGEMIERNFYGLTIWGRQCSGQSILLDGVICDIYDELHKDDAPTFEPEVLAS
jgi:hypothetical protein